MNFLHEYDIVVTLGMSLPVVLFVEGIPNSGCRLVTLVNTGELMLSLGMSLQVVLFVEGVPEAHELCARVSNCGEEEEETIICPFGHLDI